MTYSPTPLPPPTALPFDQYGRYRMIREALDAARLVLGERLRILDVGGFFRNGRGVDLLPARLFLPHDDLTVVDQHAATLPGYQQGDGRHLNFPDQAFDCVISCDTLEHVPAADRPAFWCELCRVARHGVFLAAPFASPEVVAAEKVLFSYIKAELGVEQIQLKEHCTYGLPDLSATRAFLGTITHGHHVYPSGYVHAWLAMMMAKHYLLARTNDHDIHEQIDAYYTTILADGERCEPAYRHVIIAACEPTHPWLPAIDAMLAATIRPTPPSDSPWTHVAGWLLQLLQLRLQDLHALPTLAHTVSTQAQTIESLRQTLAWREQQLHDMEAQLRWREQQSADARRALAAVEQGRLLRLLRWLQDVTRRSR